MRHGKTLKALLVVTASAAVVAGFMPTADAADHAAPPSAINTEAVSRALGHAPAGGTGAAPARLSDGVTVGGVTITPTGGTDRAAKTSGGRAYYADTADDTTTVVEGSGDAARIMTVSRSEKAPESFGYRLTVPAGTRAVVMSNGGVSIGSEKTGGVAEIEAPWARDADGRSLPTRYEVKSGNVLVQHVDTRGAVFPVVADPTFKRCGWFGALVCMRLNRAETKSVSGAMIVGVGTAVGSFCGPIPWAPPWVAVIKTACAVIVATYFYVLKETFSKAQSQGRCVELKFEVGPALPGIPPVNLVGHKVVDC